jgi:hypothetical protein
VPGRLPRRLGSDLVSRERSSFTGPAAVD